MGIAGNIRRLRELHGITQRELAAICGVSDKAISAWEIGTDFPKMGRLQLIADHFGVPKSAIIEDDGLDCLDPVTKRLRPRATNSTAPLYGTIAAGVPIESIPIDDDIPVPEDILQEHPKAFFLRVKGESMNRVLPDGAYALVDPDADAVNGDVVAVNVNGCETTIKRYHRMATSVVLQPDSTDESFTDLILDYTKPDTATVTLMGRVVWYVAPYGKRL